MIVVFRADASNRIGTGHLVRCLTLAKALRERCVEVRFICRAHPGHLIERLQHEAMPVIVLPPAPYIRSGQAADYAVWLGVSQAQDAKETIAALGDEPPDWLIVDHYGLDMEWERQLRPHVNRLMVIDDLANRSHDCDLLLDQNVINNGGVSLYPSYGNHTEARYRNRLPAHCKQLIGPRYALLRPEYADRRKTLKPRDGRIRRVLVFLGGIDTDNVTDRALAALSLPEFRHLEVDVVVGANNPHCAAIENQAAKRPRTTLHGPRLHLADLMACADLAIGAGGTTTWERLCIGLPSLVISIAENQEPACITLKKAGLIRYLGDATAVDKEKTCAGLGEMMDTPKTLIEQSIAGQLLVDGLGALRVLEAINPTSIDQLRLRPVQKDDIMIYYNWADDPDVRRQAFHSEPIHWREHQDWFHGKMTDSRSHLFVLQACNLPVGQVRFDGENDQVHIDYSLDPLVRGRGWAAPMVAMGIQALLKGKETLNLYADVKIDNHVSRAVFRRLGFREKASEGKVLFSLSLPR